MNLSVGAIAELNGLDAPAAAARTSAGDQLPEPRLLDYWQNAFAPLVGGHVHVGHGANDGLADFKQVIEQRDDKAAERFARLRRAGRHVARPAPRVHFIQPQAGKRLPVGVEPAAGRVAGAPASQFDLQPAVPSRADTPGIAVYLTGDEIWNAADSEFLASTTRMISGSTPLKQTENRTVKRIRRIFALVIPKQRFLGL
jgi:hypothetical protein